MRTSAAWIKAVVIDRVLVERLSKAIDAHNEETPINVDAVLLALEYIHACVARYADDTPANKLH